MDIPAVFYNLSFAPNPDFSKVYPPQAGILEYFNRVADKFEHLSTHRSEHRMGRGLLARLDKQLVSQVEGVVHRSNLVSRV